MVPYLGRRHLEENRIMTRTARPAPRSLSRHTLSGQLRDVIESRGLSAYALGKLAEVDPGVVSRFLTGERDIRMETADRLAVALGLRLVEVGTRSKGRGSAIGRTVAPSAGVEPPAVPDDPGASLGASSAE
jgi:hypothetical protein